MIRDRVRRTTSSYIKRIHTVKDQILKPKKRRKLLTETYKIKECWVLLEKLDARKYTKNNSQIYLKTEHLTSSSEKWKRKRDYYTESSQTSSKKFKIQKGELAKIQEKNESFMKITGSSQGSSNKLNVQKGGLANIKEKNESFMKITGSSQGSSKKLKVQEGELAKMEERRRKFEKIMFEKEFLAFGIQMSEIETFCAAKRQTVVKYFEVLCFIFDYLKQNGLSCLIYMIKASYFIKNYSSTRIQDFTDSLKASFYEKTGKESTTETKEVEEPNIKLKKIEYYKRLLETFCTPTITSTSGSCEILQSEQKNFTQNGENLKTAEQTIDAGNKNPSNFKKDKLLESEERKLIIKHDDEKESNEKETTSYQKLAQAQKNHKDEKIDRENTKHSYTANSPNDSPLTKSSEETLNQGSKSGNLKTDAKRGSSTNGVNDKIKTNKKKSPDTKYGNVTTEMSENVTESGKQTRNLINEPNNSSVENQTTISSSHMTKSHQSQSEKDLRSESQQQENESMSKDSKSSINCTEIPNDIRKSDESTTNLNHSTANELSNESETSYQKLGEQKNNKPEKMDSEKAEHSCTTNSASQLPNGIRNSDNILHTPFHDTQEVQQTEKGKENSVHDETNATPNNSSLTKCSKETINHSSKSDSQKTETDKYGNVTTEISDKVPKLKKRTRNLINKQKSSSASQKSKKQKVRATPESVTQLKNITHDYQTTNINVPSNNINSDQNRSEKHPSSESQQQATDDSKMIQLSSIYCTEIPKSDESTANLNHSTANELSNGNKITSYQKLSGQKNNNKPEKIDSEETEHSCTRNSASPHPNDIGNSANIPHTPLFGTQEIQQTENRKENSVHDKTDTTSNYSSLSKCSNKETINQSSKLENQTTGTNKRGNVTTEISGKVPELQKLTGNLENQQESVSASQKSETRANSESVTKQKNVTHEYQRTNTNIPSKYINLGENQGEKHPSSESQQQSTKDSKMSVLSSINYTEISNDIPKSDESIANLNCSTTNELSNGNETTSYQKLDGQKNNNKPEKIDSEKAQPTTDSASPLPNDIKNSENIHHTPLHDTQEVQQAEKGKENSVPDETTPNYSSITKCDKETINQSLKSDSQKADTYKCGNDTIEISDNVPESQKQTGNFINKEKGSYINIIQPNTSSEVIPSEILLYECLYGNIDKKKDDLDEWYDRNIRVETIVI